MSRYLSQANFSFQPCFITLTFGHFERFLVFIFMSNNSPHLTLLEFLKMYSFSKSQ